MKPNPFGVLVVLSGGQDSTTCLYWAKERFTDVHAITFDYGQRHIREVMAARTIGEMAGVLSHRRVYMTNPTGSVLESTSPLITGEAPQQYESHETLPGGLEATFVPMRNQLFLTIAANRAYTLGLNVVVAGMSQEDYGGYPDCRRNFIDALEVATCLGTFTGQDGAPKGFQILTPLMHLTKAETVDLAMRLPGCYEALAYSHTSYGGEYPPSSRDHASLLRAKGFEQAGIPDPLILRAFVEGALHALPGSNNYRGLAVASCVLRIKKLLGV